MIESNSNQQNRNTIDNESSINNHNGSSVSRDLIVHDRRRSGFRRRGDTTTIEGPTGAPPLGSSSMVGAAGGGPAAWAAAAFGRGEDRKVLMKFCTIIIYPTFISFPGAHDTIE